MFKKLTDSVWFWLAYFAAILFLATYYPALLWRVAEVVLTVIIVLAGIALFIFGVLLIIAAPFNARDGMPVGGVWPRWMWKHFDDEEPPPHP